MKKFSNAKHMPGSFPSAKITIIVGVIIFVLAYTGYVYYDTQKYIALVDNTAIDFSESARSFLTTEFVEGFHADSRDIGSPQYEQIKSGLMQLKEDKTAIKFAYLLREKDDGIYILADSEAPDSKDYSPPGQKYSEADPIYSKPFQDGKSIVTGSVSDRWGTWVSVLIPVKNAQTGETIAVFGVDYDAGVWEADIVSHVLVDALIGICILFVLISVYIVYRKNSSLKQISENLVSSEMLFRSVFTQAPVGIAVVKDYSHIVMMNDKFEEILGRKIPESTVW